MFPGNRIVSSGPFGVSLRFGNNNAGSLFAPSVVHDGAGCIPGASFITSIPGGRQDSCSVGLTGNWVMEVEYKRGASSEIFNASAVNPVNLIPLTSPSIWGSWTGLDECHRGTARSIRPGARRTAGDPGSGHLAAWFRVLCVGAGVRGQLACAVVAGAERSVESGAGLAFQSEESTVRKPGSGPPRKHRSSHRNLASKAGAVGSQRRGMRGSEGSRTSS